MTGELKKDSVVISDQKEGSQIYNKGNFGYPMSGGGLELDLTEATFLLETGRLEIEKKGRSVSFEELFIYASSVCDEFDIKYLVYKDIRQRGFVVKVESDEFDMSVFPRGSTMSNSRPVYLVKAVSERTAFSFNTFIEIVNTTISKKKSLLYGIVDEEGDLTYYVLSKNDMAGTVAVNTSAGAHKGKLVRDRVFVFDRASADEIHKNGFFGKLTDGTLQLSLIESSYLMSKGLLSISSTDSAEISMKELMEFSSSVQHEFDMRFRTFCDLRERGMIVKTGFKYGTHFRVYEKEPDKCHARYLVHAVEGQTTTMWPDISRAVRLAHGVKKEILFSRISKNIEYLEFKRFRP